MGLKGSKQLWYCIWNLKFARDFLNFFTQQPILNLRIVNIRNLKQVLQVLYLFLSLFMKKTIKLIKNIVQIRNSYFKIGCWIWWAGHKRDERVVKCNFEMILISAPPQIWHFKCARQDFLLRFLYSIYIRTVRSKVLYI